MEVRACRVVACPRQSKSLIRRGRLQGFFALTRMCFMAKNKTLRAVLRLNHCVTMLTYGLAPMENAPKRLLGPNAGNGDEEVGDGAMSHGVHASPPTQRGCVAWLQRVRGIIDEVLHVLGVESERANGLSVDQFRR